MQKLSCQLNNGNIMPIIGFGTFELEQNYDNLENAIKCAINIGYRHIDTAILYGNQFFIGSALKQVIGQNISRSDLFITTKYWNNMDSSPEEALEGALAELELTYVDLYLVHQPIGLSLDGSSNIQQRPLYKVWQGMENCIKSQKAKAIGVSNFNVSLLLDLLSFAEIKPTVNQIEISPFLPQENLVKFCQSKQITLTAFSPLCQGNKELLTNQLIQSLAKKYNASPAQIILAWNLERGIAVIPKSFNEERIKQNFDSLKIKLEQQEVTEITKLNKNFRSFDPTKDPFFGYTPIYD